MDVEGSTEEPENEYIALRRAKIARNEARLRELGLLKPPRSTERSSKSSAKKPNAAKGKPTKTKSLVVPVRRSSRRIGRPVSYQDVPTPTITRRQPRQQNSKPSVVSPSNESIAASTKQGNTIVSFAKNSARSISIDIHRLVNGESGCLGKAMHATGKAAVVEKAARFYSDNETETIMYEKISFNKYCGVQEWKRGIFLWVNLFSDGDYFVNSFLDGGRKITWYGGTRMHEESAVIKKLIQVGSSAASNSGKLDHSDGIVLWCRAYDKLKRNFGPYYCLGRLGYLEHQPDSKPVAFVWKLLDYDRLISQKEDNEDVRKMMGVPDAVNAT